MFPSLEVSAGDLTVVTYSSIFKSYNQFLLNLNKASTEIMNLINAKGTKIFPLSKPSRSQQRRDTPVLAPQEPLNILKDFANVEYFKKLKLASIYVKLTELKLITFPTIDMSSSDSWLVFKFSNFNYFMSIMNENLPIDLTYIATITIDLSKQVEDELSSSMKPSDKLQNGNSISGVARKFLMGGQNLLKHSKGIFLFK